MNIFQRVKGAVSVPEAARRYGMQVHRSNMACCPFHNDRTPSLKLNESYYYCFGCQASGDVVNLTAALLGVRNYDAAKALVTDFGITGDGSQPRINIQRSNPRRGLYSDKEMRCYRAMAGYLRVLRVWQAHYAPKSPEDETDERFAEACQNICYAESMIEGLAIGKPEEREALADMLLAEGTIERLEGRIALGKEDLKYEQPDTEFIH